LVKLKSALLNVLYKERQFIMLGFTIVVLVIIILTALLSTAIGSKITIELGTLLWIILASLITGAVWMILLVASLAGSGLRRLRD
jgi:hypothetical protein